MKNFFQLVVIFLFLSSCAAPTENVIDEDVSSVLNSDAMPSEVTFAGFMNVPISFEMLPGYIISIEGQAIQLVAVEDYEKLVLDTETGDEINIRSIQNPEGLGVEDYFKSHQNCDVLDQSFDESGVHYAYLFCAFHYSEQYLIPGDGFILEMSANFQTESDLIQDDLKLLVDTTKPFAIYERKRNDLNSN